MGNQNSQQQQPPATVQNTPSTDEQNIRKSALYSALYDAYMNTLLEADKSILTISAGGVGLLVTLLGVFNINSYWHILLFALALFFFVVSIVTCIFVFKRNRVILMNTLAGRSDQDSLLSFLDYTSIICVILGIMVTVTIGISVGIQKLEKPTHNNTAQQAFNINTVNGNVVNNAFSNTTTNKGGTENGRRKQPTGATNTRRT